MNITFCFLKRVFIVHFAHIKKGRIKTVLFLFTALAGLFRPLPGALILKSFPFFRVIKTGGPVSAPALQFYSLNLFSLSPRVPFPTSWKRHQKSPSCGRLELRLLGTLQQFLCAPPMRPACAPGKQLLYFFAIGAPADSTAAPCRIRWGRM